MAIINRVKYDGPNDGSSWLVHKYPSEQFVLGSQLIVNQGQEALFFKGGEAFDLFSPGTHTLKTGNLPLLNKLVNLPFGGETPFSAEVYFANKTSRLDMNWGTSNPIPFEDPKYSVFLNLRAYGQYGISISDTRLFISRIIGAIPNGSTANYIIISRYFNGLINTKIKDITAKYMISNKISFLEISAHLDKLSLEYHKVIGEEFERFGLEILNFYVQSILPRDEDIALLKQRREEVSSMKMELIELGRDFYAQRRSFDVLDKLAENPSAGSMANAGLGLGIGLGAAGSVGNAFGNIAGNINPSVNNVVESKLCPKCNAKLAKEAKFCGECGEKLQTELICPHCGKNVNSNMKFCAECGGALRSIKCTSCGTENQPGMKFCGNCGTKIKE